MQTKFVSSIRDPVYGAIPITECEQDVLSLPIINRLRGIKQLGLAYLAFPGANHSRFEHSLGTMHVASLMCQGLGVSEHVTQTVRIAALLHDVGHAPYSHTMELALNMFQDDLKEIPKEQFSHEEWTKKKINTDKTLQAVLRKHLLAVRIEDIADIAVGQYGDAAVDSILNSPVDADKTDYILRDNLHCGFPVALDINTITEILELDKDYGCIIRSEGLSFVEQLLIGRYHLITKIHQNKLNRLGNYLMALCLRDAILKIEKPQLSTEIDKIFEMTDHDFHYFLKKNLKEDINKLDDFLMGKSSLKQIENFDYSILTPMDRFNASIIASRKNILPELSNKLTQYSKSKGLFVDVNQVKLPELDLLVCSSSGQKTPIINTPLVRGIVTASLSWLQAAVYSFEEEQLELNIGEIKQLYKELDEDIDQRFDYMLEQFENKKTDYGLFLLTNLLMHQSTKALHQTEINPEDNLIIVFRAVYELLSKEFSDPQLFVDGILNLASLVELVQNDHSIYQPLKEKGIKLKEYDLKFDAAGKVSSRIFVDVEKLISFGMLYCKEEIVKYRKFFNKKQQLRLSGWGRSYYAKNLATVPEIAALYDRIYDYLGKYIQPDKEIIKEYLTTSEVEKDIKMRDRRQAIRARTKFRITR